MNNLAVKGEIHIQLRDAVTGELTYEHTQPNMLASGMFSEIQPLMYGFIGKPGKSIHIARSTKKYNEFYYNAPLISREAVEQGIDIGHSIIPGNALGRTVRSAADNRGPYLEFNARFSAPETDKAVQSILLSRINLEVGGYLDFIGSINAAAFSNLSQPCLHRAGQVMDIYYRLYFKSTSHSDYYLESYLKSWNDPELFAETGETMKQLYFNTFTSALPIPKDTKIPMMVPAPTSVVLIPSDKTPPIKGDGKQAGNTVTVLITSTNETIETVVNSDNKWEVTPTMPLPQGYTAVKFTEKTLEDYVINQRYIGVKVYHDKIETKVTNSAFDDDDKRYMNTVIKSENYNNSVKYQLNLPDEHVSNVGVAGFYTNFNFGVVDNLKEQPEFQIIPTNTSNPKWSFDKNYLPESENEIKVEILNDTDKDTRLDLNAFIPTNYKFYRPKAWPQVLEVTHQQDGIIPTTNTDFYIQTNFKTLGINTAVPFLNQGFDKGGLFGDTTVTWPARLRMRAVTMNINHQAYAVIFPMLDRVVIYFPTTGDYSIVRGEFTNVCQVAVSDWKLLVIACRDTGIHYVNLIHAEKTTELTATKFTPIDLIKQILGVVDEIPPEMEEEVNTTFSEMNISKEGYNHCYGIDVLHEATFATFIALTEKGLIILGVSQNIEVHQDITPFPFDAIRGFPEDNILAAFKDVEGPVLTDYNEIDGLQIDKFKANGDFVLKRNMVGRPWRDQDIAMIWCNYEDATNCKPGPANKISTYSYSGNDMRGPRRADSTYEFHEHSYPGAYENGFYISLGPWNLYDSIVIPKDSTTVTYGNLVCSDSIVMTPNGSYDTKPSKPFYTFGGGSRLQWLNAVGDDSDDTGQSLRLADSIADMDKAIVDASFYDENGVFKGPSAAINFHNKLYRWGGNFYTISLGNGRFLKFPSFEHDPENQYSFLRNQNFAEIFTIADGYSAKIPAVAGARAFDTLVFETEKMSYSDILKDDGAGKLYLDISKITIYNSINGFTQKSTTYDDGKTLRFTVEPSKAVSIKDKFNVILYNGFLKTNMFTGSMRTQISNARFTTFEDTIDFKNKAVQPRIGKVSEIKDAFGSCKLETVRLNDTNFRYKDTVIFRGNTVYDVLLLGDWEIKFTITPETNLDSLLITIDSPFIDVMQSVHLDTSVFQGEEGTVAGELRVKKTGIGPDCISVTSKITATGEETSSVYSCLYTDSAQNYEQLSGALQIGLFYVDLASDDVFSARQYPIMDIISNGVNPTVVAQHIGNKQLGTGYYDPRHVLHDTASVIDSLKIEKPSADMTDITLKYPYYLDYPEFNDNTVFYSFGGYLLAPITSTIKELDSYKYSVRLALYKLAL